MADPATSIQLPASDLSAYRTWVISCASPEEREQCERLLGQLASLEARATSATLEFVPGPRSAPLANRALAHLREERRPPDSD
jgi:hypothetical protein